MVASSILTVSPVKIKKKGLSHVQVPVRLNHLKTTMRAIRSLQVTPIPRKSEVKLDTGHFIGVPGIIWEICQVLVEGECGGKTSLKDENSR